VDRLASARCYTIGTGRVGLFSFRLAVSYSGGVRDCSRESSDNRSARPMPSREHRPYSCAKAGFARAMRVTAPSIEREARVAYHAVTSRAVAVGALHAPLAAHGLLRHVPHWARIRAPTAQQGKAYATGRLGSARQEAGRRQRN
jgi:hypothetical protein